MLFRIITWLIVIGVVFRLINRYIRPVFHVSTMANDHLRKMQQQMNEMQERMQQQPTPKQTKRVKRDDDYIDYEEIK